MGTLTLGHRTVAYQWASDVAFDGIRMEVISDDDGMLFDVSVPDNGPIAINTFGREVDADLIVAAVELAKQPR